jgi:hypothetical protein
MCFMRKHPFKFRSIFPTIHQRILPIKHLS